jgi:hypothetical protein
MKRPTIDITRLPDLDTLTGVFGSLQNEGPAHDDSIVILGVYVYEVTPLTAGMF